MTSMKGTCRNRNNDIYYFYADHISLTGPHPSLLYTPFWKCNLPMATHVRPIFGRLVGSDCWLVGLVGGLVGLLLFFEGGKSKSILLSEHLFTL